MCVDTSNSVCRTTLPIDCYTISADARPPIIKCPDDISVSTDKDESTATVLWEVPAAIDNSGILPNVEVTPAVVPPTSLPIGTSYITYVAEDVSKNKAKCKFKVIVSGDSSGDRK